MAGVEPENRTAQPAGTKNAPSGVLDRKPMRRIALSGFLFGCGIAASMIDLFIFHLSLQWHHFYDLSTPQVALTADGFFHAFGWFITVWGLFLLADIRRRKGVNWRHWAGGVVLGAGVFQLFDGIVDHKVLRIHQIRYNVNLLPYDLVWNGSAVVVIVIGLLVLWRTGRTARIARATPVTRAGDSPRS